ncbi:MAG TPA: SDR family NAD(P)-dependent oxidoreductase [archaeon]|nr:SDR family NAD(P)-dependent oxidoreductase [archaeon]
MNILVTGGAGFIGRHLVNRLVSKGYNVTVYDNFSTSKKDSIDKVKIIEGDVRDVDDVQRAMKGMEVVFHLAAITETRSTDDDLVYNTNFIGSKTVFETAKAVGAKVIFTSSAAVYGDSKSTKESDECHPISQYGKSKLRAEKVCPEGSFIVRLFNAYGPGGHSVINKFCKLIPKYEDVTIFGHGNQTRDFIYVDDVVSALMLGLEVSGTYNIGTGKETSVMEIVDMIHSLTKSKPNIKFGPAVPEEIMRSKADITNIQKTTWFAKTELPDGITSVLKSQGFDFSVIEHLK